MTKQDLTDYHKITRPLIYGLSDTSHELGGERLIYVGVTTRSLSRRRAQHLAEAADERSDRAIHRYLRDVIAAGREDDINVTQLDAFGDEAEALKWHAQSKTLLNEKGEPGSMPEYTGPDWTEEEIQMLRERPAQEVVEKTGYKRGRVADARKRLGVDDHGRHLTKQEAREVFERYCTTEDTYEEIAGDYDVSAGVVGRIVRGDGYEDAIPSHPRT